jgi:histidinol-phosphate aminotransferase
MKLQELIRPNIRDLKPYVSARHAFSGNAHVFLDANENPFSSGYNRYPDPLQNELKTELEKVKGVKPDRIFLGNGSDESIDLLIRIFCEPGEDNIILLPPTYGMYKVCADISNVACREVGLSPDFQPRPDAILQATDGHTKILFVCSPNNPTGNLMKNKYILDLLRRFPGIIILDEAYIDFAGSPGWLNELDAWPNLVLLQTLSKAWGSAGIRLGITFASKEIVQVLNKVKPPYNVSQLTQEKALSVLKTPEIMRDQVKIILSERQKLIAELQRLPMIEKIFHSDANFLLVKAKRAPEIFDRLRNKGIITRDRSGIHLCDTCLRITIGTPDENTMIIDELNQMA